MSTSVKCWGAVFGTLILNILIARMTGYSPLWCIGGPLARAVFGPWQELSVLALAVLAFFTMAAGKVFTTICVFAFMFAIGGAVEFARILFVGGSCG